MEVTFEEACNDVLGTVRKIADYMGVELAPEEILKCCSNETTKSLRAA
jgi:hypothetical protein